MSDSDLVDIKKKKYINSDHFEVACPRCHHTDWVEIANKKLEDSMHHKRITVYQCRYCLSTSGLDVKYFVSYIPKNSKEF